MKGIKIFDTGRIGPTTLVVGLVHGNENIGKYILDLIETNFNNGKFSGKIISLIGNPEAYSQNKRFIDQDLNRSFGEFDFTNIEIKRAKEIKNFFIKNKIKIDYVFDIHSTPTDSEPMIICSNNKKSLELSDFFPIKYVILGLADIIEGVALTKYFSNLGAIDLAFECGFHNDINNKKVGYKIFEIILKIQNSENLNKKFKKIKIKIINSLKTSNKKFRFSKVFKGFEVIKKGEILANEEDNIISMEEERIMVIPRIDAMEELDFKKEVIVGYLGEKI